MLKNGRAACVGGTLVALVAGYLSYTDRLPGWQLGLHVLLYLLLLSRVQAVFSLALNRPDLVHAHLQLGQFGRWQSEAVAVRAFLLIVITVMMKRNTHTILVFKSILTLSFPALIFT